MVKKPTNALISFSPAFAFEIFDFPFMEEFRKIRHNQDFHQGGLADLAVDFVVIIIKME